MAQPGPPRFELPRPLRRAVALFVAAGVLHALLAAAALLRTGFPVGPLVPIAAPGLLPATAVALLGAALAALSLAAAAQLARMRPRAPALAVVAAVVGLLNMPFGAVLGLVALAQLQEPRVRAAFRRRRTAGYAPPPRVGRGAPPRRPA